MAKDTERKVTVVLLHIIELVAVDMLGNYEAESQSTRLMSVWDSGTDIESLRAQMCTYVTSAVTPSDDNSYEWEYEGADSCALRVTQHKWQTLYRLEFDTVPLGKVIGL